MSELNGHTPGQPQPPSAGEQLGLGRHWEPVQIFSWDWKKLTPLVPGLPERHVLILDTSNGRLGFGMASEDIDNLVQTALIARGGLTIAQPGDVPPAL